MARGPYFRSIIRARAGSRKAIARIALRASPLLSLGLFMEMASCLRCFISALNYAVFSIKWYGRRERRRRGRYFGITWRGRFRVRAHDCVRESRRRQSLIRGMIASVPRAAAAALVVGELFSQAGYGRGANQGLVLLCNGLIRCVAWRPF